MSANRPERGPVARALRTTATLTLLQAALPLNLALTGAALVRGVSGRGVSDRGVRGRGGRGETEDGAQSPRTILVSGGKMTKALQLCRSFHDAGHRVVLVEQGKYALTGHRFSNAVDAFHAVPKPQDPGYAAALLEIVQDEGVDVYVPVCSPVASWYDAMAAEVLAPYCEVVHCDAEMIETLDDKHAFAELAKELGLSVPDSHRVTSPEQVSGFDFDRPDRRGKRYILKSIPYDPVQRLDLTTLPRPTDEQTRAFAQSKPMSDATPWIMQEFVEGQEYCTHGTVRDGELTVYCCCESSPFQINYEHVDKPEIEAWVRHFVKSLGLTGQVSFDFMEAADGRVFAIECNPRTHSAITMFYDQPELARAYLEADGPTLEPTEASRPTYWLYHEVWRLLAEPHRAARARTILAGKDAIFDWSDPLPFLVEHHVQIPWLLLQSLRHGKDWMRIDFNIGKLVEPAGD